MTLKPEPKPTEQQPKRRRNLAAGCVESIAHSQGVHTEPPPSSSPQRSHEVLTLNSTWTFPLESVHGGVWGRERGSSRFSLP